MDDAMINWSPYAKEYDPLKAGSIDGTDTEPHDKAVSRAIRSHYEPPHGLKSNPSRTVFIAKLNPTVTKDGLIDIFSRFGKVISAKLIVDIVTGHSRGYGFVEMATEDGARRATQMLHETTLRESKIIVDMECGRTMKGWKPRRLGGGFGGKKESGQLRFGGKDRPFKRPIVPNISRNKNITKNEYHRNKKLFGNGGNNEHSTRE